MIEIILALQIVMLLGIWGQGVRLWKMKEQIKVATLLLLILTDIGQNGVNKEARAELTKLADLLKRAERPEVH